MEVVTIDSRNGDGNVHYSYAPGTANRNAYVRTLAGFDAGRLLVTAGGSRNRLRCRRSVRCDDHHRRHGEAIRRLPDRQRIRRAYGCWRVVRLRLGQTSPDQKRGRTAHDRHRRQAGRLPRQQPQRIRRRPATLPNAAYTSMEDDSTWVVFKDAKALAGSPYESKQREYADCEAKNPDFTQPIPDMGPQHQYSGEDKQAALAYAQAARKKGFDWVKDPDADTPTSITIPGTVSESELRRFLKECPTDGANISYAFAGTTEEFGYDYNKVLSEFTSGSASTEAAPQQ